MLVARLAQVVRRQWLIVVLGVVLTGAAGAGVTLIQPPTYDVTATALLLPPRLNLEGQETNPYLQLGGLTTAVDVLARALNDPQIHDKIVMDSTQGDYEVERDQLTAAPLLNVTAESATPARAQQIRDQVLDAAPQALQQLQANVGVPTKSRLTLETLISDGAPELNYKSLVRSVIVVVGAGLALTILLSGAVDAWRARRAAARTPKADGDDDALAESLGLVASDDDSRAVPHKPVPLGVGAPRQTSSRS